MGRIVAHRFELLEPIGQGGTGSVWVALDHERATLAAVKLLKHADAGGVVQFAREQAMRIRSEHVIAPYTWAAADEQVAIAMPLRTGGSLAVLVADFGALPTRWIAHLGSQAAQAIAAVHAATGMVICPHTAVGFHAACLRRGDPATPMVVLATAHPAKFPDAVEAACGVRPALPPRMADLFERPERVTRVPDDLAVLEAVVGAERVA